MKKSFLLLLSFSFLITAFPQDKKYPYNKILELQNCHKETRIFTFGQPSNYFVWWVKGQVNLESNKVVKFSKDYHIDSNYLRQNIEKVKKSLPKDFWGEMMSITPYNNEPNDDAIWFIKIFAEVDKANKIKIYSAIKITFEGNDARMVSNRNNPKVKNVEFIIDKAAIEALTKKLKTASKVEYRQ